MGTNTTGGHTHGAVWSGEPPAGTPAGPEGGPRAVREVNALRSADLNPDTRPPLLPVHGERALAVLRGEHANTLTEGEALHASQWTGVRESAAVTPVVREYHPFEQASQVEVRRLGLVAPDGTRRTVSEFTVTAQVRTDPAMTPQDVVRARAQVLDAVDLYYNHQHRLPDGSQLHVRVEFGEAPASATGVVRLSPGDGTRPGERPDMLTWYADMDPVVIAHEVGHHLDLGDEYVDPGRPGAGTLGAPGVSAEPGLMGSVLRSWSDHTLVLDHNGHPVPATVGLRDHHLAELGRRAGHAGPAGHGDEGPRVPGERWTPRHDADALELPSHVRDLLGRRNEDGRPVFAREGREPLEHAAALDRTHALFRDEVPPERLTDRHVRYTEALTDAARRLYETAPDYSFRESDLRGLRALADVVGAAPDGVLPHADLLHQAAHQALGHAPSPRAVEALTGLAEHLNTELGGRRPFELPADALRRAAADRVGGPPGPEAVRLAIDRLAEERPHAKGEHPVPQMDSYERRKKQAIQAKKDARANFQRAYGRDMTPEEREQMDAAMRDHLRQVGRGETKEQWRPSYRKATREGIQRQYDTHGNLLDANTGQPIPKGKADIGHKPGYEWRDFQKQARNMKLTDAQIAEIAQYSDAYHMEFYKNNRSHRYEQGGGPSKFLDGAKKNSDGSVTVRGLRIYPDGRVIDASTKKEIPKSAVPKSWKKDQEKAAKQAQREANEAQQWLNDVSQKSNPTAKERKALDAQAAANEAWEKANKSYFLNSSKQKAQEKAAQAQQAADEARNKAKKGWFG